MHDVRLLRDEMAEVKSDINKADLKFKVFNQCAATLKLAPLS